MTATEHRVMLTAPSEPSIASGQLRALNTGRRALGAVAFVLPTFLAGYALFDKGFAYIHIPGTPIFAGEVLVLLCLGATLFGTGYIHRGLEHSTVAKLLLAFGAFGLVRTVPHLAADGLDAVRDAALWYYALVAIPICALIRSDPDLIGRWARNYRRLVPWLLVYSPIALFLSKNADAGLAPLVPGSDVSFWNHAPGNIAVTVTLALAFLWLVPEAGGRFRPALTGIATVVLLIGATQNRGGLVAAIAGLGLVWLFARRRGRLTLVMIAMVAVVIVLGWGLNVQIRGEQGRRVSVEQLIQNIGSLTGKSDTSAAGNLDSNVQFRNQLWSAVIKKVKAEKRVLTGLGFGPNVAAEVGFQGQAKNPLRSPHNSHVDVFARMGLIGAAIWAALWSSWYLLALRTRLKLRAAGRAFEVGVVEVCIVGVTAILVNAYFDPTLESPQVALWLWSLVGITMGLAALARHSSRLAQQAATSS